MFGGGGRAPEAGQWGMQILQPPCPRTGGRAPNVVFVI
jgi:hypothetical protein